MKSLLLPISGRHYPNSQRGSERHRAGSAAIAFDRTNGPRLTNSRSPCARGVVHPEAPRLRCDPRTTNAGTWLPEAGQADKHKRETLYSRERRL